MDAWCGHGRLVAFAILMAWTGLSITAGYHRLWSHKSYEAHPVVKYILLLGATLAVESSVFDWCSGHRSHHRHVDDEYDDPYSSRRGFGLATWAGCYANTQAVNMITKISPT